MDEATKQERIEHRILTWLQIIGIIGAAAWAVYTFIFKEIWSPKAVPVNTTLALELKPGQPTALAPHGERVPLSISASASNPSERRIHLLHSVWMMYGYRFRDNKNTFDKSTVERILESDDLELASRFSEIEEISLIAGGNLFDDDKLSPKEHISRTEILYVPSHAYDAVEAVVFVPSAVDADDISLEWEWGSDPVEPLAIVKSTVTNKELKDSELAAREYSEASSRIKISF